MDVQAFRQFPINGKVFYWPMNITRNGGLSEVRVARVIGKESNSSGILMAKIMFIEPSAATTNRQVMLVGVERLAPYSQQMEARLAAHKQSEAMLLRDLEALRVGDVVVRDSEPVVSEAKPKAQSKIVIDNNLFQQGYALFLQKGIVKDATIKEKQSVNRTDERPATPPAQGEDKQGIDWRTNWERWNRELGGIAARAAIASGAITPPFDNAYYAANIEQQQDYVNTVLRAYEAKAKAAEESRKKPTGND